MRYLDVAGVNADIIVIAPTGINDGSSGTGSSAAVIQSEVTKLYNNIRSVAPLTPIIWFGCNGSQGAGGTPNYVVEQGVQAAIAAITTDPNLLFVPVQLDTTPWMQYDQSYLNPATSHPSDIGYLYMAQRMAGPTVRAWIQKATWQ